MPKSSVSYICQSCGAIHTKWSGKCEACGEWNTLAEEMAQEIVPKGLKPTAGTKAGALEWQTLAEGIEDAPRTLTGIGELDRVLGGGLVQGSAILIGGDPGIGKSTLLLQVVAALAKVGLETAYISGEESIAQIALRAKRLHVQDNSLKLATATSVRDIIAELNKQKPDVVVIDSIQTMYIDSIESAPGTVTQVRACSNELIRLAKKKGFTLFLVGHVTKEGQLAGPRVLEHMVDTVLYFEGERGHQFRILRAVKNRFGGTDEIGVFSMTDRGLEEVANPSALFLADRQQQVSGSAVFAGMEGSRPLLVEIQALVSPSFMSTPRRAVIGWDAGRLAMILAVLETRVGLRFGDKEVYLNVAGGMRVTEPAADLAVAAALISSLEQVPVMAGAVLFGEIGLSGEIRRVSRADTRLKEAAKLGFENALAPYDERLQKTSAIATTALRTVRNLAENVRGRTHTREPETV